jgi:hypothetical protein
MNRQQRRAARKRKFEVGTMIKTRTIALDTGAGIVLYWFEEPANFSDDDCADLLDYIVAQQRHPPGITLHRPFKTNTEVQEHQRVTLLGSQCEVCEGGVAGLWRIQTPDGRLSDMVNLAWAKDAALSIAVRTVNSQKQGGETPAEGPPVAQMAEAAP